ncbi:hypothetical protein P4159_00555 [Bacillus thuringiensis]|uniref:Uncharacterized protein n=1 Tax=Bacillus thuringiensis subsp. kurstaki TaxID=29339 RepID=Q3YN42_BACTK|nr:MULTISPECIES: hypothetical protein [Bacillus cereus group]MEB9963602.1 hypothetical protein [Bacillus cereus]AAZ06604.1 hypothetical protein pAW63_034 [Bacillus thuringiensis serovar kurstaki]AGE81680.1 hypothetical protein HD73_7533 [Bacillus thuringiensis serovar kurstaki str. HD73]AND11262.1 hypothetical protein Bt4C1_28820 [Bacillus thuringiensis serovar alesti]EJV73145.1 hypothetical protein IG1_05894 [Bacillus cereus HD73]
MDIERKKKDDAKFGKGLIKILSIIIFGVGCLVYIGISLNDYVDEINKEHATKIEQTHENIKIAEEMIEKELNINRKYFKMLAIRILLYTSIEEELNTDTDGYWVSKHITCKVQLNGENYSVIFETIRVGTEDGKIEMYEPVKINKIIKNVSN